MLGNGKRKKNIGSYRLGFMESADSMMKVIDLASLKDGHGHTRRTVQADSLQALELVVARELPR
jgi:hypothetical protein